MAQLTGPALEAELRRKAQEGIAPTSSANTGRYEQIRQNITNQVKPQAQPMPAVGQKPQQPFQLGQDQSFVRQGLTSAGFTNIGYDKPRNMVTANGMDVLQPDKVVNGSSVASSNALSQSIARLREQENQNKQRELMTRLESMLGQAPKPQEFNYNPETDPQYQAALRRAGANAQTATGNAMAEMNRRGLLNSTIMGDRAAQIQQGEFSRVSDELLPQLMQQAYGRQRDAYGDQYQQYRDQVGDVGNLFNTTNQLGQQAFENQYTTGRAERSDFETDRAYDRGNFESDREFNYTQGRDKVADQQWEAEFNRIKEQEGIQNAIDWANNSISRQREKRISSNQSSGGGTKSSRSSGSAAKPGDEDFDPNMPLTMGDMYKYIEGALPAAMQTYGPSNKNDLIERMILSNPNLSDKDIFKLYQKFGIKVPEQ